MKTDLYSTAHNPSKKKTPKLHHFHLSYREKTQDFKSCLWNLFSKVVIQFLDGENLNHQITNLPEGSDKWAFLERNLQISSLRHCNAEQSLMPII